jgi:hypothetical protein
LRREDEQHKVADAIVKHLETNNWKIEPGPPFCGHGTNIMPPKMSRPWISIRRLIAAWPASDITRVIIPNGRDGCFRRKLPPTRTCFDRRF